jgi:hypothetical protein
MANHGVSGFSKTNAGEKSSASRSHNGPANSLIYKYRFAPGEIRKFVADSNLTD